MATWTGTIQVAGGPRSDALAPGNFAGAEGAPGGDSNLTGGAWSWLGDLFAGFLRSLVGGRGDAASQAMSQSFSQPTPAESNGCCCCCAGAPEVGIEPWLRQPQPPRITGTSSGRATAPETSAPQGPRTNVPSTPLSSTELGSGSFDASVRGPEPNVIDLELARLAQDVYDPEGHGIDGWRRLDAIDLQAAGIDPEMLEDLKTGFRAAIYTDDQGRHVLAFAGTNDWRDWLHNVQQGVGLDSEQYEAALEVAYQAKAAFGDNLVITGHSLGGGLASVAALDTDTAAVTFNAAGLHDTTIRALGYDPTAARAAAEAGLIRRYAVDGEALTGAQEQGSLAEVLPDAVGHKIELGDPDPLLFWERLIPGNVEWFHPVQLHPMDSVLAALEGDRPWIN
ncbi:MAG: Mbeg1-like protein [Thermoanaerobaculia bacterium]